MTNPDREELVKLNEAGLEAAVRECARITAPEITDDEYEQIKADNSPRYQNTRTEMARAIRAYLASSDSGVKVKPLVWRDHRPDSFPEPALSAQTSFGFYNIEEVSASDSPAYVVRLHAHHFVADKDSLDEAKAAAQADYEARIKSALVEVPADAGMREAFVRVLASLAAAISILERTPKAKRAVASDKMFDQMLDDYRKALEAGRSALTAPDATTKSDGDGESK